MTGDHLNVCKLVDWTSVIVRFSEVGPRWQKTKLLFLMSISSATVSSSSWKTLRHSQRYNLPNGIRIYLSVSSSWEYLKKGRLLSSILTWTHNDLNGLLLTVLQALYLYDCHPKKRNTTLHDYSRRLERTPTIKMTVTRPRFHHESPIYLLYSRHHTCVYFDFTVSSISAVFRSKSTDRDWHTLFLLLKLIIYCVNK